MNKNTSLAIITTLKEIIPNPVCELNFNNTFELLCAVMLSSQTTDKRVNMVTPELFAKFPTPLALSQATYEEVFPIIKSLGFANTKAKNIINMAKQLMTKFNGEVPRTFEELESLSGVGHKTASVVLAVGYKIPAMPVDTHLDRMSKRLGYAPKNASIKEVEAAYRKYIPEEDWIDAHHLILLFGRYYCKAINPSCTNCKLKIYCKVENK